VLDISKLNLDSKEIQDELDEAGIYLNRNAIPFDKRNIYHPSGLRLGSPAITSRGMKEKEASLIASFVAEVINHFDEPAVKEEVRQKVKALTKPIATATSVMRLVGQGKVDVDQRVSKYLPEFSSHGKEVITVSDLLLHIGGLIPDNSLKDYQDGPAVAWDKICALKPIAARGEKFAYTDVGFIVLEKLVERVGGKSLDRFASDEVFVPLGMKNTRFNPNDHAKRHAAPTEQRDGQWIKGEVHDPRSYLLDGVAGHAGLFSTAGDLVRYGQMMLGSGKTSSVTILKPNVFSLMTKPRTVPRGSRTFGWDHQSPYSSNRGEGLSDAAFGHGGFTGTVMWIDPEKERIFIFLSNRLHPEGKGTVNKLAGKIATLVGSVQ